MSRVCPGSPRCLFTGSPSVHKKALQENYVPVRTCLARKMEDAVADPLLDAIATARVPTDRPCSTRHLAIAPPYDWSRTYMAAKDMEEYLPGVPLDATLVEATEDGFDVLASDGVTSLVHIVVERGQAILSSSPVSAWRATFCARAGRVSGSFGPGLAATSSQWRRSQCQLPTSHSRGEWAVPCG